MLNLAGAESVVTCPLLPLLAHGIECSTSKVASSIKLNDADDEHKIDDVDADHQDDLTDPFDNEEEYVGVDDENMYDITMHITITEQPEVPTNIEGDDNTDKVEVMQHIQEEAEVVDLDPL
jgi:hypothetical protein